MFTRRKLWGPYREVLVRHLCLPGGLEIEHRVGRHFAQMPPVIVRVPKHVPFQASRKKAAEIVRKCWQAIQAAEREHHAQLEAAIVVPAL